MLRRRSAGQFRACHRHDLGTLAAAILLFELGSFFHTRPTIRFTILSQVLFWLCGGLLFSLPRLARAPVLIQAEVPARERAPPHRSRGPPRHMPGVASPARPATVNPPPPTRRADGS